MPVTAATLKRLSALKVSPEAMSEMLAILSEAMAADDDRLAKQRDRKARQRQNMSRDSHGTEDHVPGQSRGQSRDQLPPKERNQTPHVSELRSDTIPVPKTTPRLELEAILDPEHAAAVIDHRQRLGSGLTAHAAKLLAAEFAKCADPNAAADVMIARGWRGFKPKWLEERHNGPAGPPPKPPTGSAKLVELLKKPFEETYGRSNGKEPPGATVLPIRNR